MLKYFNYNNLINIIIKNKSNVKIFNPMLKSSNQYNDKNNTKRFRKIIKYIQY